MANKKVKPDIGSGVGGMIAGSDAVLIDIHVITDDLKNVEKRMRGLEQRAPAALQSGINRSLTEIRKALLKHIKQNYALQQQSLAKKAIRPKRARISDLKGKLYISGEMLELKNYKYKPGGIQGIPGQRGYSVAVKKERSPVHLTSPKAFWTSVRAGDSSHEAIFARVPDKRYTDQKAIDRRIEKYGPKADLTKIKKLLGPSVPGLVATLYRQKESEYEDIFEKYLQIAIEKQFAKYG